MFEWTFKGGLCFCDKLKAHELEEGGEGHWVNFRITAVVFAKQLVESLLMTVRGEMRILQHKMSSWFQEIMHFCEKCLQSSIAQSQVHPLHCAQADHCVVDGLGLHVEEVVVQKQQVAWKLLYYVQALRQHLQKLISSDDMPVFCFFCCFLKEAGKLSNSLLDFLVAANCCVLLIRVYQPINSSLADGEQVCIDVECYDSLWEHSDGNLCGHCAIACSNVQHCLIEKEIMGEIRQARVTQGIFVLFGSKVSKKVHATVLSWSDVDAEGPQLSQLSTLPSFCLQASDLLLCLLFLLRNHQSYNLQLEGYSNHHFNPYKIIQNRHWHC